MEFRFIARTLVYDYHSLDRAAAASASVGEWRLAGADAIQAVFANDPRRCHRFQKHLAAQHMGLLLLRGQEWISYGWCRAPGTVGPPHLPRWTRNLDAYWIFGCHTREGFRRQGIYKELLARLIRLIRQRDSASLIYIDTHAQNIASRRAILASGFQPAGLISTYRVWLPVRGSCIVAGRWLPSQPHPDLPRGMSVPKVAVAG